MKRLCALALPGVLLSLQVQTATADVWPTRKDQGMESAKRRGPAARPVVHAGIRYEQMRRAMEHGFKQSGGVIVAVDEASGKQLWATQLYETTFDAREERDVQEVYVSSLALDAKAGVLTALDERKRTWRISILDGKVLP